MSVRPSAIKWTTLSAVLPLLVVLSSVGRGGLPDVPPIGVEVGTDVSRGPGEAAGCAVGVGLRAGVKVGKGSGSGTEVCWGVGSEVGVAVDGVTGVEGAVGAGTGAGLSAGACLGVGIEAAVGAGARLRVGAALPADPTTSCPAQEISKNPTTAMAHPPRHAIGTVEPPC